MTAHVGAVTRTGSVTGHGPRLDGRPIMGSAALSDDRQFRYQLLRIWDDRPLFVVIGLNPSTADEQRDDPTIRRCINFALDHECGGLVMLNLFAFRATKPADLWAATDPIGPDNDAVLAKWGTSPDVGYVVAAWGNFSVHQRAAGVTALFGFLHCLSLNQNGSPRHPLYLPSITRAAPWRGDRSAQNYGSIECR